VRLVFGNRSSGAGHDDTLGHFGGHNTRYSHGPFLGRPGRRGARRRDSCFSSRARKQGVGPRTACPAVTAEDRQRLLILLGHQKPPPLARLTRPQIPFKSALAFPW